jgi:hypothetical protein
MRVKMLRTEKGSPNGIQVRTYEQGKEYDIPGGSLPRLFIETGVAVAVAQVAEAAKNKKKAPENKNLEKSPENKKKR